MGAAFSDKMTTRIDIEEGYAEEYGPTNLHEAAAKAQYHKVSICLKKGADPNERSYEEDDEYDRQDTVIMCAIRGHKSYGGTKKHLKVIELIYNYGGSILLHNRLQQTVLQIACQKGYYEIATWLIANGADVDKADKVGLTPLWWACKTNNLPMVQLLLSSNARVWRKKLRFHNLKFSSPFDVITSDEIYSLVKGREKQEKQLARQKEIEKKQQALKQKLALEKDQREEEIARRKLLVQERRHEKQRQMLHQQAQKVEQEILESMRIFKAAEEQKRKHQSKQRLAGSGKWVRSQASKHMKWEFVKVQYVNRNDREVRTTLDEAQELMNALKSRRHKYLHLRPTQSAPDTVLPQAQRPTSSMAKFQQAEAFRPITAPVFGDLSAGEGPLECSPRPSSRGSELPQDERHE